MTSPKGVGVDTTLAAAILRTNGRAQRRSPSPREVMGSILVSRQRCGAMRASDQGLERAARGSGEQGPKVGLAGHATA